MTRPVLVLAVVGGVAAALAATDAGANGRAPATSTIHFERGNDQNVAAGMTFGLVFSSDGGQTWSWMCEAAVGYGGIYDPAYAYTQTGAVFGTTFNGLAVMRDGCTFNLVQQTGCTSATQCTFVSADTTDGSGDFFYAAADPNDAMIYRSQDDGMTFPQVANPYQNNTWWESIDVAPSDSTRVYLTGYFTSNAAPKVLLEYASIDGGSSFTAMPGGSAITTIESSIIDIASVDPNDEDTMYVTSSPQAIVTVTDDAGVEQHAIYGLWKTTDGGQTFTQILTSQDYQIYAVARQNGQLVAASQGNGVVVSSDQGSSWSAPMPNAPHVNCITENAEGEVWACTLNYGTQTLPSDGAGIMKTTDAISWTPVLRYQDIVAPVSCPTSTIQYQQCQGMEWCTLKQMLLITSDAIDCTAQPDAAPRVAPALATTGGGCCDGGGGGGGVVALAGVVAMIVLRRRPPAHAC